MGAVSTSYVALMLLAIAATTVWVQFNQRRSGLGLLDKLWIGLSAFVFGTLFAKLPFAWKAGTWTYPTIFLIEGKTLLYGLVGGYVGVEIAKKLRGVRSKLGDAFAAPVALGAGLGRISCFVGSCCYGSVCNLPWGVHFANIDADATVRRHPTQLYELAFHLTAAALLWMAYGWLHKVKQQHELPIPSRWFALLNGNLIKIYFIAYFAYRFLTEFIRPEPVLAWHLTEYQWASVLFSVVFAILWRRNYHPVTT